MSALLLNRYTKTGAIFNAGSSNLSGGAFNKSNNRVGLIRNGLGVFDEYDKDDMDTVLRRVTLPNLDNGSDTEAFVYLPHLNAIAVTAEHGGRNMFFILDFPDQNGETDITLAAPHTDIRVKGNNATQNSGPEALEYLEDIDTFIIGIEGEEPGTDRDIIFCKRPTSPGSYTYADTVFAETHIYRNFVAEEVFAGLGATGAQFDISDFTLHDDTQHLIIASHTANLIVHIDPNTGTILNTLPTDFTQMEVLVYVLGRILAGGEPDQLAWYDLPPLNPPVIIQPPNAQIAHGETFAYTPSLSAGEDVFWWLESGPDTVVVNQETGEVTFDTSVLLHGHGLLFELGCCNSDGWDIKPFALHVDKSGTSKLVELGVDTVSPYIRIACLEEIFNAGDTLAVPAGHYWASVTADGSYENTFADAYGADMPTGTSEQLTTILGVGEVIVDSNPHDGIPRQDEGLETTDVVTPSQWVNFTSIEWTGANRQAILSTADNTVFQFCGGTDSGYAVNPMTHAEADVSYGSVAAFYVQGNGSVVENCFAFGQGRYLIQVGNPVSNRLTARNFIRPDEYHGVKPRGGLTHYAVEVCGVFDNLVFDADHEHLSPFFGNWAGAYAFPATLNESFPNDQLMNSNLVINCQMISVSNDANAATSDFTVNDLVAIEVTGTTTPWGPNTATIASKSAHVFHSKTVTTLNRFTFYDAKPYDGGSGVFITQEDGTNNSAWSGGVLARMGWDGSANQNHGDLTQADSSGSTLNNCNVHDFSQAVGGTNVVATNIATLDPLSNGLDYPVRVEAGSPLALAGQGADLTVFSSPSNVMPLDPGWRTKTTKWAWPRPGELRVAARARTYNKTNLPVRNASTGVDPVDFTGSITGDRGLAATGMSISEGIWGRFGRTVPPLRVSAQATGLDQITFRVGKYRSTLGDTITKFNVYETTDLINPVLSFSGLKGVLKGLEYGTYNFVVRAVDTSKISAYTANESGESGDSRELNVVLSESAATSPIAIIEAAGIGTSSVLNLTYPVRQSSNGSDRGLLFWIAHESADLTPITGIQVGGVEAILVSVQGGAAIDQIGAYILEADIPSMSSLALTYTGGTVPTSNVVNGAVLLENVDPESFYVNVVEDGFDWELGNNTKTATFDLIAKKDAMGIAFAACSKTDTAWTTGSYTQLGAQFTQNLNTAGIIAYKSFTANGSVADTEIFNSGTAANEKTAVFAMMVQAKIYIPDPVNATINAVLPELRTNLEVVHIEPVSIVSIIDAVLPELTVSLSATHIEPSDVVATINTMLSALEIDMTAAFIEGGAVFATIDAVLPELTANLAAVHIEPEGVNAIVNATLSTLQINLSATHIEPGQTVALVNAVLPTLTVDLMATYVEPEGISATLYAELSPLQINLSATHVEPQPVSALVNAQLPSIEVKIQMNQIYEWEFVGIVSFDSEQPIGVIQ